MQHKIQMLTLEVCALQYTPQWEPFCGLCSEYGGLKCAHSGPTGV